MDPDVTFLSNGWVPVARVLFITVTGYATLIVLLRLSGQRTIAQMSGLDFVVTVTIGSAFGRVITAREVALLEVVAAFVALVGLQWLIATVWRRARIRGIIEVGPTLLYYDGEVVDSGLRRHRLVEEDLHAAARQEGLGSLEQVRAVLLERNGTFAVLQDGQFGDGSSLRPVRGAEEGPPP